MLLTGSADHEGVPIRTAATHVLDWLIKLAVIGAIAGIFRLTAGGERND